MSDIIEHLNNFERPQFDEDSFYPFGSPSDLLMSGVFNGSYFDDSPRDLPEGLIPHNINLLHSKASQPRSVWISKGWIHPQDPLGWLQWYLRYYNGRRSSDDYRQISRWKSFNARHGGAVRKLGNCDINKRSKQRQALLHWACNPVPDFISE